MIDQYKMAEAMRGSDEGLLGLISMFSCGSTTVREVSVRRGLDPREFATPGVVTIEALAYRPVRSAPRLTPLITAIGVSLFLQNAAMLVFSPNPRP